MKAKKTFFFQWNAVRSRMLPDSWYPDSSALIDQLTEKWSHSGLNRALAALVPHAGWYFSGEMAWQGITSISPGIKTVVVIGGHLPADAPLFIPPFRSFETPLGPIETDVERYQRLFNSLPQPLAIDEQIDNTIEVLLPLIKSALPQVRLLPLRLPADERSIQVGRLLSQEADIAVIASADLTHYGSDYGFRPAESLSEPDVWVEKRDRRILDAACRLDAEAVLQCAVDEQSSCSAGAIAAMTSFARERKLNGQLLTYRSSREIRSSDSFVGYGVVVLQPGE